MKTYYFNTLGKINRDTKISLFSDFHMNNKKHFRRYNKVINLLEREKPDYIFLLGDMVDDANLSDETLDKVQTYLNRLSSIAPVYYIYGNHEFTIHEKKKKKGFINNKYINMLKRINNFYVLDNESVLLKENIGVIGIKLPYDYYINKNENVIDYLALLKQIKKDGLLANVNDNSYNIFLQHTPNNILDRKIYHEVSKIMGLNCNLILSGHLHNGLIPPYIDKFISGNRGIIGVKGRKIVLFPNNCRGIKKISNDTYGLVLPAVSTLDKYAILNSFFPPSIKTIILKK